MPAKQFIDSSLTQIHKQLEDESIFPTKFGEYLHYHYAITFLFLTYCLQSDGHCVQCYLYSIHSH